MSNATLQRWTTEFTCRECGTEVVVGAEQVTAGAFEYDSTFTQTSRSPYVHCTKCQSPYKLGASEVPAQVLREIKDGKR